MTEEPEKKKGDYSLIVNISFVLLLSAAVLFIYAIFGFDNIKGDAEKAIKEKSEQEIQLPKEDSAPGLGVLPPYNKYKYVINFDINVKDKVTDLVIKFPISTDEKERQYITDTSISPKPTKIYNNGVSTYAEYYYPQAVNQNIRISVSGTARVRNYSIGTAKIIERNISPEKDLSRYLAPEPYIESEDDYIKSIANKIEGSTQEEIVKNIYKYEQNRIHYIMVPTLYGAKKALKTRNGKCSEFSAAMVALCRAKNIPARVVMGYFARKDNQQHDWVEVYYDKYGWVMYDPTAKPTVIKHTDAKGNVIKRETSYDVNYDVNYIATGRNSFKSLEVVYNLQPGGRNEVPIIKRNIFIEPVEE